MKNLFGQRTFVTAAIAAAVASAALPAAATVVFSDDFEAAGPAGTVLGAPNWILNGTDGGGGVDPMNAVSATNGPFASGSLYANLTDDRTDRGQRLISANIGASINDAVSTMSFDFYQPSAAVQTGDIRFGYGDGVGLFSGTRRFSARLQNGEVISDTEAFPIPFDTVHRVFLVVNDGPTDLLSGAGGQVVEAGTADVWVSVGGAAPVFAFQVDETNAGGGTNHAGFRSFNSAEQVTWIDNVVVETGVASAITAIPEPGAALLMSVVVTLVPTLRRRS